MSAIKNVIIIGGAGEMGGPILQALIQAGKFNVTALTREDATTQFPQGIPVVKTDYSPASLEKALQGQDAVVSVIGGLALQLQPTIVEAAAKVGVKRFLPAEYSTNSDSDAVLEIVPPFQVKRSVLDLLKSKESSGMSWTGIATGPAFDYALETGFFGFDLKNHTATIWDDGNARFSASNIDTLAQAVPATLLHLDQTANKYLYVDSFTTTQNEVLASVEKHTGKKFTITHVKTQDVIDKGLQELAQGNFAGAFALVKTSVWGNKPGMGADYTGKTANKLLGLAAGKSMDENVEEVVKTDSYNGKFID